MRAHDPDDRYVRIAVMTFLSLTAFAGVCATAIHWLEPRSHPMDRIIPPLATLLFTGLIVALRRHPERVVGIARLGLAAGAVALAAPAWLYTVEATRSPGLALVDLMPPVSSLFVVFLAMLMIFIPGRRAFAAAALAWVLIALPVLAYLLAHPAQLWTPRGRDLLMAYGPASLLIVVLLPVQRGLTGTIRRLAGERNRIEAMLHRDPLTGAQSRLLGEQLLHAVLREHAAAGVIMLDLDHFKAINDTHGHPVGDRVLQAVVTACQRLLRGDECIARWGGEEFLVIVPQVDAAGLAGVAERLCAAVAAVTVPPAAAITASFGTTLIARGDTLDRVLQRADAALYRAKAQGGDCVVSSAVLPRGAGQP